MPNARRFASVALVAAGVLATRRARAEDDAKPWYERLEIGGYAQIRYNRLAASSTSYRNDQADEAIGSPARFSLRRARLKIEGDVGKRLHLYLQTELAGAVDDSLNIAEIRDAYGDVAILADRSLRLRAGISKIPYAFENMQSSQDRAPFDRSDGINSAQPGERDIGAFLLWAPAKMRKLLAKLSDEKHKGSGDYGVVALGVFNGQGLNERERNTNKHVVARVSYPFQIGSQVVEIGAGGVSGRFVAQREGAQGGPRDVRDVRLVGTLVLYPKPVGMQAEYNVGVGPERAGDAVVERPLDGGYVTVVVKAGQFFPYARVQRYDGGWKSTPDAPRRIVHEAEVGLEWHAVKAVTLKLAGMEGVRVVDGERAHGRQLRAQVQLNY